MPLPKHIDLRSALLLCLGIDPKNPPSPEAARRWCETHLATALEVPALEMEAWMRVLETSAQEIVGDEQSPRSSAVPLEILVNRVMENAKAIGVRLDSIFHSSVSMRLEVLFRGALRVDPEELGLLVQMTHRQTVIEASGMDEFIDEMIAFFRKTIEIEEALGRPIWYLDVVRAPDYTGIAGMKAQSAFQRFLEIDESRLVDCVPDILSAWAHVFETSAYEVCKYLWHLKEADFGTRRPLQRAKGSADKRAIWNSARAYCGKKGIEFPFDEHLPDIRNSVDHGTYKIHHDRVSFSRGHDLSHDHVVYIGLRDIITSTMAGPAYTQADFDRLDEAGYYDEAWQRIVERVPELPSIACSDTPEPAALPE